MVLDIGLEMVFLDNYGSMHCFCHLSSYSPHVSYVEVDRDEQVTSCF